MRVLLGRLKLYLLRRDVHGRVLEECGSLLTQLSGNMGIKKRVMLVASPKCSVPFTAGFLKPVIIFPSNVNKWPEKRVHAVLLHELAHVKRRDYLTQYIARIICSIFWFIPFIWIAYARLCREVEKACDRSVIRGGVKPADYASHMLKLACFKSHAISFEGAFLSRGRKKVLEDRILSALRFKNPDKGLKGGNTMKPKNFILACVIIALAIAVLGSCATRRKAISEQEFMSAYTETWINTEYTTDVAHPRLVCRADGIMEHHTVATGARHPHKHSYEILDHWVDRDGTIWYKALSVCSTDEHTNYELGKISDSGNTLEYIISVLGTPIEKWEPENDTYKYRIYYRK
jgi:hypothetical protein